MKQQLLIFTIPLFIIFFRVPMPARAQAPEKKPLMLSEVVEMVREQSVAALLAETERENSYWQFRTYRANLYPQVRLSSTLPDFAKTYSPITQDNGSVEFQPVRNNNSVLNLELSQNIGLTGGEIFVSSELRRFDDFERKQTRYSSNPVFVGYRQSIFSYNPFRWDRKIQPLRYESSRREYLTGLESVSLRATRFYFNLLLAQINFTMAQQNVENGQKTLDIAKVKHEMGKISENDLLQVKYNLLNDRNALARARQDMQTADLLLKSYVGLTREGIEVVEPTEIPELSINQELALSEAKRNKETELNFQIRELEAGSALDYAKKNNGLNAELFATLGLVNASGRVGEVYQDPIDQQTVRLGLSIPIMDWGRSKARVKTAEANQKLVEYSVRQDQINFEQEIITQAELIRSLESQLPVAEEAAVVARQRYRIAGESFALGKISITELSIAQNQKDQARRTYLQSLQLYWESYYNLRKLTLYDFERQKPILEDRQ